MLTNNTYKLVELLLLFVAIPIILAFPFYLLVKVLIVLLAIIYCLWIAKKFYLFTKKELYKINHHQYWKMIGLYFLLITISTSIFVWKTMPENLFIVLKKAPLFWLGLILFYSIFSVYPQEILYRLFFFKRYQSITSNTTLFIIMNILVFPLAHLFFHNWFLLFITLIGGILFSISFYKSKSLMVTFIEHALYGSWLFTIGMGEMLGFPMPSF